MKTVRFSPLLLSILLASSALPEPVQAGPQPAPWSIKVTNVQPSGSVTGGQKNTVTADVAVTGLPDGTYDVTVVTWNNTAGTSKTTTGTVTITNGKGTVSISADFPTGNNGDQGLVQVEVIEPTSGHSGAGQSSITYK